MTINKPDVIWPKLHYELDGKCTCPYGLKNNLNGKCTQCNGTVVIPVKVKKQKGGIIK